MAAWLDGWIDGWRLMDGCALAYVCMCVCVRAYLHVPYASSTIFEIGVVQPLFFALTTTIF